MVWRFKSVKLFLSIFVLFLTTYLFFDLLFNTSRRLELYVKSLPSDLSTASIIILLLVADILLPVPASIVMVASGVLFGGFWGGVISLIGSLAGTILNFQLSRKLGQRKVRTWMKEKEYNNLSLVMHKFGAYVVIFTRIVPLLMESVSAMAGLSKMKLNKFILMNVIGFLPITFLYSFTGAIYKDQPQNILIVLTLGFFVPLIFWFIFLKVTKKPKEKSAG